MQFVRVRSHNGFTLIELLVVIAIIGVLASVVLASLNSARGKARDARRLADIREFQLAIELYRDSNNGACPGNLWYSSNNAVNNNNGGTWAALQTLLAPYMPSLPHDPSENTLAASSGGYGYSYHCWAATREYMIVFNVEDPAKRTELDATDGYTHSSGAVYDYGTAIVRGSR